MAAMPIYGKTQQILFSRTRKALRLNLGIYHQGLKVYQVCSNDVRGLTFGLLWQGQICAFIHLNGEMMKNHFLSIY